MSFYNTISLKGDELKEAEEKAETQEDKVLDFFQRHSRWHYTPWEVRRLVFAGSNVPITSVRRAINNLTDAGKLEKTDEKRVGPYGKPSYAWALKKEKKQMRLC